MHAISCGLTIPCSSKSKEVVPAGPWEGVWAGQARKGLELGHHYHRRMRTYFYVIQGEARIHVVDIDGSTRRTRRVASGEGILVDPGQAHMIRFTQDSTYLLLKSGRSEDAEADTIDFRLECSATSARKAEGKDSGLTYFPL